MTAMYDEFEVINGPEDGSSFPVGRVPAYLGADPDCTVRLMTDPSISRRHARITTANGGYRFRLEDGEGLLVNGRRAGVVNRHDPGLVVPAVLRAARAPLAGVAFAGALGVLLAAMA